METQVAWPTTILTLELAANDREYFERLRQLHYPPALNRVPAHVSLFHTLPPLPEVKQVINVAAERPAFVMRVTGVRLLGRGIAFVLESPELAKLRKEVALEFEPHLTAQDRQPFKPHVAVQNKVQPAKARELEALLAATFHGFSVEATGLNLWNYLGGPWELAGYFPFR